MKRLAFVVPVHGRAALTGICLRQLRRTCDELRDSDIDASAIVVGDDGNLETARELGFGTVERNNRWLSRKFNDGIQLACDRRYNRHPADYVVPCGSDDWVDSRAIAWALPDRAIVVGFQLCAFVSPDGTELHPARVGYRGGVGIRIYPRELLEPLGFRPADEDRERGCDTSILVNVTRANGGVDVEHRDSHALQIVDFKSPGEQLNALADVSVHFAGASRDPWPALAQEFPQEAVDEMQAHYAALRVPSYV